MLDVVKVLWHDCVSVFFRKYWEDYIRDSSLLNGLFGIKWHDLNYKIGKAEVTQTYILNPKAPEFVPNSRYHVTLSMKKNKEVRALWI